MIILLKSVIIGRFFKIIMWCNHAPSTNEWHTLMSVNINKWQTCSFTLAWKNITNLAMCFSQIPYPTTGQTVSMLFSVLPIFTNTNFDQTAKLNNCPICRFWNICNIFLSGWQKKNHWIHRPWRRPQVICEQSFILTLWSTVCFISNLSVYQSVNFLSCCIE